MKFENKWLLFEHTKNDYNIIITNSIKIKIELIYKLNDEKFKILKKYIDKNLTREYIQQSKSRIIQSILFVFKKNEKHKLCVDYKKLNAITKKKKFFVFIERSQKSIKEKKIIYHSNLKDAINLIKIKKKRIKNKFSN